MTSRGSSTGGRVGDRSEELHRLLERKRVFAGAFVNGRKLEQNIDLRREAEHPCVFPACDTTKHVVTHRLRVTDPAQLAAP